MVISRQKGDDYMPETLIDILIFLPIAALISYIIVRIVKIVSFKNWLITFVVMSVIYSLDCYLINNKENGENLFSIIFELLLVAAIIIYFVVRNKRRAEK